MVRFQVLYFNLYPRYYSLGDVLIELLLVGCGDAEEGPQR
jgi:hypothetical protein